MHAFFNFGEIVQAYYNDGFNEFLNLIYDYMVFNQFYKIWLYGIIL